MNYNEVVNGDLKVSKEENILIDILYEFGISIDSQGASGGNYDKAMKKILKIINKKHDRT